MKHLTAFKVGIAWQGSTSHKMDRHRSIRLRQFAPLARVPGVHLIGLQIGAGTEQLDDGTCGFPVQDLGRFVDAEGAFTDKAALMKQLNLVIACDTSLAHLAGALRVPVWIAVSFAADWRWLRDRDDSPWYPTMRIFRQKERGNWEEVVARMAAELGRVVPAAAARPFVSATEARALEKQAQDHLAEGNLDDAAVGFREALRLRPDAADLHRGLGVALALQGRVDEAVAAFREALHWRPDSAGFHNDLGLAYLQQGRPADAEHHFQQAVRGKPESAEMRNNLGVALARQKKHDEAACCYRQALRLDPHYVEAHTNLGFVLRDLGRLDEAVASGREAVRLKPDLAEAQNNLGLILARRGEAEQADACYRRALEINPGFANAHNNRGIILGTLHRHAEALASFEEALRHNPRLDEARYNRSLTRLALGRWEEGWPEFECRESMRQRSFPQPRWDGTPLAGRTILLHTEQGMGDTFQFVRFAEAVRPQAGRVLLECPPPLVPLLKGCGAIDQVIAGHALAAVRRPCLAAQPPGAPRDDPGDAAREGPLPLRRTRTGRRWGDALGRIRAFRIGIAWQGNPAYVGDRFRSVPLVEFRPVAAIDNVQLLSLQKEHNEQLADVADRFVVLDLARQLDGGAGAFLGAAAATSHLDLVLTCDTAIAHLAGAMGVPTWVVLPFSADWRWLLARDDSPWYPTVRLFRQSRRGDWPEVFARVAGEIEKLARAKTGPAAP